MPSSAVPPHDSDTDVQGNKGASALRFTLHSTVLTFVNAHLAAFDEYTDRRNADFHDLSRRLLFLDPEAEEGVEPSSESIFQSDALFWMVRLSSLPLIRRRLSAGVACREVSFNKGAYGNCRC